MGNTNWGTPNDFFDRCNEAFGPFGIDLAANEENKKCKDWIGPGSKIESDFFKTTTMAQDFLLYH